MKKFVIWALACVAVFGFLISTPLIILAYPLLTLLAGFGVSSLYSIWISCVVTSIALTFLLWLVLNKF